MTTAVLVLGFWFWPGIGLEEPSATEICQQFKTGVLTESTAQQLVDLDSKFTEDGAGAWSVDDFCAEYGIEQ